MSREQRTRLRALDRCLELVEDALSTGQERVDGPLAERLRLLLGLAGLIPDHRMEGRLVERVLDDIFALQAQVLGHEVEAAG